MTRKYAAVRPGTMIMAVFVAVALVLAAGQRSLENRLFTALSLREKMGAGCSGKAIDDLLGEMRCFPVQKEEACAFENGYGDKRTYGGKRTHEGTDVMSLSGKRGELTVCSVSDGVVEKIGWLKLGGYRVGVRSPRGYYFYYAHLSEYASGLKRGMRVRAGDALGMMGDTGYGPEGTRGKFPVHLHFGIYRKTRGGEKSLNPYYLLQHLQSER